MDGSPATEKLDNGLESTDLDSCQMTTNANMESLTTEETSNSVTEDLPSPCGASSDVVQQRRAMFDDKLSNCKQAKLKRKLHLTPSL